MTGRLRRWSLWLGLICSAALAIRVAYVFLAHNPIHVAGDAYQYHYGANALIDGRGLVNAFSLRTSGLVRQTALHPPLYTMALAVPSAIGWRSALDHQLWSCLLGTITVALVGLVGRRLAGPPTGLMAAGIAAIYPNLWRFDGQLEVETLSLVTAALALLCAYRLWRRPSLPAAVLLGLACALAALTRGEGLLYLPLLALPTALAIRRLRLGQRAALVFVAFLAAAATLAPWVGFNLGRFDQPVLGTGNFGVTLAAANCGPTYSGPGIGYWSPGCLEKDAPPPGDESDDSRYYSRAALGYVGSHLASLPAVVAARVGRAFDLYHPVSQLRLEAYAEGGDLGASEAGLVMYYLLLAASVAGAVMLKRRGLMQLPLLGLMATGLVTTSVSYGITRYRISAELALVLLGAVGVEGLSTWLRSGGADWRAAPTSVPPDPQGTAQRQLELVGVPGPRPVDGPL